MRKKLDVLVGQLRDEETLTTAHLYRAVGREQVEVDGRLRWRDLRDTLTRGEAHELVDRLEAYAAKGKP